MHVDNWEIFFADLEQNARARARELENAGKLPAGFVEHHYPLTRLERIALAHSVTAWRLAPDIETLRDLLAGAPVDVDRLDQEELLEARRRNRVVLKAAIDEFPNIAEAG